MHQYKSDFDNVLGGVASVHILTHCTMNTSVCINLPEVFLYDFILGQLTVKSLQVIIDCRTFAGWDSYNTPYREDKILAVFLTTLEQITSTLPSTGLDSTAIPRPYLRNSVLWLLQENGKVDLSLESCFQDWLSVGSEYLGQESLASEVGLLDMYLRNPNSVRPGKWYSNSLLRGNFWDRSW